MASCRHMPAVQLGLLILLGACRPASEERGEEAPPRIALASSHTTEATALTCSYPVARGDTIATLQARFGSDARAEMLGGAEGSESAGIALWPDDPARRLEVFFDEGGTETVSFVRLSERAEWRVASLAVGDPLMRVREINGRPFTFSGFGWDYGGYVGNWSGGQLEELPGGCTLSVRLDALGPVDEALAIIGDVTATSDTAGLGAADIRVVELGIGFGVE